MLQNSCTMIPYDDIDFEIKELVKYINKVQGIETVESCCGHEEMPCQIYFRADSIEDVTKFQYKYLYCNRDWRIVLQIGDISIDNNQWDKPIFILESTVTDYKYNYLVINNLTLSMRMKDKEEV